MALWNPHSTMASGDRGNVLEWHVQYIYSTVLASRYMQPLGPTKILGVFTIT